MKNRIFTAALLAALCLVSCVKSGDSMNMEEASAYSYTLEIENDQEIDAKSVLNNSSVEWELNDRINFMLENDGEIIMQTYSHVKYLEPRPSFGFTTSEQLGEGDRILCWCSSAYYSYTKLLEQYINIPTTQTHKGSSFDGASMPMVSVPYVFTSDMLVGSNNELDRVKFHNLASLIDFKVFSTKADYQGETVNSISFEADKNLAGTFVFNVGNLDPEDESTLAIDLSTPVEGQSVSKSVTTESDAVVGSTKDDAGSVRMVVAPGSYTGKVVVNTNKAQYVFNVTELKSFSRNGYYPLGLDLSKATRLLQVELDRSEWTIELANATNMGSTWSRATNILDGNVETLWDSYTGKQFVLADEDDYVYNHEYNATHWMQKMREIPNMLIVIDMGKPHVISRISISKPSTKNCQDLRSCEFYMADTFVFKPVTEGGRIENYNTADDGNDWKKVLTITDVPKTPGTWWYDVPQSVPEADRTGRYIKIRPTADYGRAKGCCQISEFKVVATIVDDGTTLTD